jgi:MHS family proline/betaine transporter-like MFS transporter
MIGNALEWYDFVIYGYFVAIFGTLFFPNADPTTKMLAGWIIFWAGFIARPLGSIVFGQIGDKVSRKSALTWSIYIMAIPTALMGCLPTYAQIGIAAPILLVILRTMQGFAIGGEFTGSMVFLVEHAPANKRGFWGSWASFSAVLGVIIGSMVVTTLNSSLSHDEMLTWGWRFPFVISILGSVVAGYIRSKLSDPAVYLEAKAKRKNEAVPLKDLMLHYKGKMATIFFLDFLTAVGFFMVAIFMATFFRNHLKFDHHIALTINTINMCVFAAATLFGGWISDRIGRISTLKYPCIGFILLSYPLFLMMQTGDQYVLLMSQGILALMMGVFFGTIPTTLVEIIPTSVRFSGLSISHNICMAILGGGTPLVATHLIHRWGGESLDLLAPAYLLIFAATVSLASLWFIKDKYQQALD